MRRTWQFRRHAPAQREEPSMFPARSGRRKGRSVLARWSEIGGWSSWMNRILFRGFELLLGAAHFVDEFLEAGVILLCRRGFHGAGNINSVWINYTNRFGDVFNFETAGENDTTASSGASGEVPIGGLAGATIL